MTEPEASSAAISATNTAVHEPQTTALESSSSEPMDLDGKLSRKREREVSVEPVSTPKAVQDSDPLLREPRDSRSPLKKNRRHLDSTAEEEDGQGNTHSNGRLGSGSRSHSGSPPLGTSPPTEMKIRVRQISQGVEDLNWKKYQAQHDVTLDPAQYSPETPIQVDETEPTPVTIVATAPEESIQAEEEAPATAQPIPQVGLSPHDTGHPHSDDAVSEREKGMKRKFLERGTSEGPPELANVAASAEPEALKRPRDDTHEDENPRQTKRPTPPPSPTTLKKSQPTGFMAYASVSSPFAAVKGDNVFSSKTTTPVSEVPPSTVPAPVFGSTSKSPFAASSFANASSPSPFFSRPIFGQSTTPAATPAKRPASGFEPSASGSGFPKRAKSPAPVAASPSSSWARSKSPARRAGPALGGGSSAFSAYASGGVQGFAITPHKAAFSVTPGPNAVFGAPPATRSGSHSEEEKEADTPPSTSVSTFGERLRASGKEEDEDDSDDASTPKIDLTEQELFTGEEEEDTIHQVRGKLYSLVGDAWKEKGTGLLKLNVSASDGTGARLVMRKDAVYALMLNVTLFKGMKCLPAQDPRYVRFSVFESGSTVHYNLRLGNAKIAHELIEVIQSNVPAA